MTDKVTLIPQTCGVFSAETPPNSKLSISVIFKHQISASLPVSEDTKLLGAYVLVSPYPDNGKWACYVGKSAEGGLYKRINSHMSGAKEKISGWTAAILLHNTPERKLSQDEASALEHFLYDMLKQKPSISLVNENPPPGNPLMPIKNIAHYQFLCEFVLRMMPVLGAATDMRIASQQPESKGYQEKPKASKVVKISLSDLIAADDIKIGDVLVPHVAASEAEAVVLDTEGRIRLLSADGSEDSDEIFTSLSQPTSRLTESGCQHNGWQFWRLQRTGEQMCKIREKLAKRAFQE